MSIKITMGGEQIRELLAQEAARMTHCRRALFTTDVAMTLGDEDEPIEARVTLRPVEAGEAGK